MKETIVVPRVSMKIYGAEETLETLDLLNMKLKEANQLIDELACKKKRLKIDSLIISDDEVE